MKNAKHEYDIKKRNTDKLIKQSKYMHRAGLKRKRKIANNER